MLKDKLVLVTGASSGIGRACAEAFARAGCRLILAARRRDRLAEAAAHLGAPAHLVTLDVRDRAAVDAAIAGLPDAWRNIDILVNNAGLSRGLDKLPGGLPSDWEEMIDTNVKGLLWVSRAVLPGMIARDRGHVINIGSIAGHQTYPGGAVYCATKHAVAAINRGLRLDLLGTRVRVSSIDPGMVETDFSLVRFHGDRARADQVYRQFPPLQAADIADCVLFCATRPPHVAVMEMIVMPQDQASVYASHPRGIA
ncbi:MAG TPA: SDR family NAD(P)-dependent oxidoreductase [Candidatus Krumholzibacteria bacterium]|nr:SDR family NAD(P)-dependent oxidoreductase [Candidatus Krumholzibacteria bacterium]HPD70806.1 SDR family NAD(P)-dependent oxidoreductase [Candidatus Krumholzibacteria bacterium]HRY39494.1 SDR family NAD(P)-dependent oxidoreductase [Candidatus Krumholzibacteria bacterium]